MAGDSYPVLERPAQPERAFPRALARVAAAVEEHYLLTLCGLLAVTAAVCLLASLDKPLWLDEFFSLHTALLASPGAIWTYQRTAPMALDPPLYHWLSHYGVHIFGTTALGARSVSIGSYLVFTACIFTLMRKVANAMAGLFAVSFAFSTALFDYAVEARPYSLLVAAGAGALVMWYWSWNGKHRLAALAGLAACVATAMLGHYFGCLIAAPIAAGELVRWRMRRKISFGVVLALAAGGLSAASYFPLIAPLKQYQVKYIGGVDLSSIFNAYKLLLEPCAVTLALLVVGLALTSLLSEPREAARGSIALLPAVNPAMVTAFLGFAALPFFAYVEGRLVTHAFAPRFAVPGGIGLVLLAALALAWAAARRPAILTAAVLLALVFPGIRAGVQLRHAIYTRGRSPNPPAAVFAKAPDLPIVVGNLEHAFQASDQMGESLRRRCVLLTDPAQARIIGDRTDILSTVGMRRNPTVRIDIENYGSFLRLHPHFLVLGDMFGSREWIIRKLLEDGGAVRLEGAYGHIMVFSVNMPSQAE